MTSLRSLSLAAAAAAGSSLRCIVCDAGVVRMMMEPCPATRAINATSQKMNYAIMIDDIPAASLGTLRNDHARTCFAFALCVVCYNLARYHLTK